MSQLIKVFFDNVEVAAPSRGFSVKLERDTEIRGLVKTFSSEIEWIDTAYDALYSAFLTNNIYDSVDVEIQRNYDGIFETVFSGLIYVNDIVFNLTKKTATCTIQDATFYGKINNNKKIKTLLSTTKQKNLGGMSAVTPVAIDFFTPSTGALDYTNRDCVKVYDAFENIVEFMTDGEVTFDSNYFGSGGDEENLVIATGSAIRNNTVTSPNISFYDLFTEISKLFNISFTINNPLTAPEMQIEPTEDLFVNSVSLTLTDVNGLTMSFDKDLFYGKLEVGSSVTQDDDAGSFTYPDGAFYGHKREEYHLLGQSNIDVSLDLVNEYVIDANVIEDVLVNSNTSYDDDVFIVETDGTQAIEYDEFNVGTTPSYYNFGLNNQNKCERWLGGVPNSIAAFLSTGDETFEATRTGSSQSLSAGTTVALFNNVVSNPASNYTAGTGKFVPTVDGAYSFQVLCAPVVIVAAAATVKGYLRHRDSGGTLLREVQFMDILYPDTLDDEELLDEYFGSATFYMTATDEVTVEFDLVGGGASLAVGASFKSSGNSVDGGIFQFYEPSEFRAIVFSFNYPLTKSQFNTIFSNQTRRVKFTHFGDTYYGWVKSIDWDIFTGMAQIELYASFKTAL